MADSIFDVYLKPSATKQPDKVDSVGKSIFDVYLSQPQAKTAPQPIADNIPRPFTPEVVKAAEDYQKEPRKNKLLEGVKNLPSNYWNSVGENSRSGINMISSGFNDIADKNPATGIGKIALGGLGYLASPITGLTKELINRPVTELTGDPKIGDSVEFGLTAATPIRYAGNKLNAIRPSSKAVEAIIDSVGKDNLSEVVTRMKENPRLSVMDLSGPTQQMGQKLVVTEGPQQDKLYRYVKTRADNQKDAVVGYFDDIAGAPVNVFDKLKEMQEKAREVGKKQIVPAIIGAKPVDVTPVIAHIDSITKPGVNALVNPGSGIPLPEVKQAIFNIRKHLANTGSQRVDPGDLHEVQKSLRAQSSDLLESTNGLDRQKGHAIKAIRDKIVEAIDQSSGGIDPKTGIGNYRRALASYKDEMDIKDAFGKGMDITKNRPTKMDDRPEFWVEWIKKADPAELEAAKEGARVALDTQMRAFKSAARRGTDVGEIDFNRDKLTALFGKTETDKLYRQLKDIRDEADTNQKLVGNSATAARLSASESVKVPDKLPFGQIPSNIVGAGLAEGVNMLGGTGIPMVGAATYGGLAVGNKLINAGQRKAAQMKNNDITDWLTVNEGPKRDKLIKTLEDRIPKSNLTLGNKLKLLNPFNP